MREHLIFSDLTAAEKSHLEELWRRERPRLERLLRRIPEDQRHLRLHFQKHPDGGWSAHGVLQLPTGALVATEDAWDPRAVVDRVADTLRKEIQRHKDVLRREHLYRRKRRQEEALSALAPVLEKKPQPSVLELLRPLLRGLRDTAARELALLQLEGRLHPGEVSVGDLLDEVLVRAAERWPERPETIPLERWLMQLLHQVVDEKARERPAASLEEEIPPDDPRFQVEVGWLADNHPFWEEPVILRLEDALPDVETPEPWQELAAEEEEQRLLAALRGVTPLARRAFFLTVVEGWSEEEAAMALDVPPAEVPRLVEEARAALRERVTA